MPYTQAQGLAFWYEFDKQTKYAPALVPVLKGAGAFVIQDKWHEARVSKTSATFVAYVQQRQTDWTALAKLQRDLLIRFFPDTSQPARLDQDSCRLAFEDFGQGLLADAHQERIDNDDAIHMMDTGAAPPVGYHRWHASIRAIQTFDADPFWGVLDQLSSLAWAIQSVARPKQQLPPINEALTAAKLKGLRDAWLPLGPERLDRQYDLGSGREGYHPSPTAPAA